MNDDVEESYINSTSNESRCTSLEVVFRAVRSGGFRYSFGIGFVRIIVQHLSGSPLKLVFFVQILKNVALPCGPS